MSTLTDSNAVTIEPLPFPTSLADAGGTAFTEMVRVRNMIYEEIDGDADDAATAAELLPHYQPDPNELRLMWLIRREGDVIGRVGVDLPLEDDSKVAYWLVELLQGYRHRGIGSRAYEIVEQTARVHGRTVLQSWATHPERPGARLTPPTGFGEIPRDEVARFYERHGYRLEQVERKSRFDLTAPIDQVDALFATASEAARGYRVEQWRIPTPPEYVNGYAWAKSRMSTDVPAGGLEFDEETWDAARLAKHEQAYIDGGRTMQVTAAIHEETGQLVAFNELVLGVDPKAATQQQDTLVLREHRGHRLGMLVKCAGIRSWRAVAPLSPRIITFNAEENRPMLDVNEAIGFTPAAYVGAWKKVLHTEDAGTVRSNGMTGS